MNSFETPSPDLNFFQKILRFHWIAMIVMFALCAAGLCFVYSAVHSNPGYEHTAQRQVLYMIVGLGAFFVISLIDYSKLVPRAPWIYLAMIGILVAVLLLGDTRKGATSWFRIAGVSIQPAELCKLAYLFCLGWLLAVRQERAEGIVTIILVGIMSVIPVGLILIQPDFGSAAVFGPMCFFALMVAGTRLIYLCLPLLAVAGMVFVSYTYIYQANWDPPGVKPHQVERVRTFFDPDRDPLGAGYTIRQSLLAVGSGGMEGKGYLQGDQNIYGFIPRNIVHNDFIFSVIAEEVGFWGASLLIIGLGVLILCVFEVAAKAGYYPGSIMAAGFGGLLFAHTFVNVGMTIQVVPITGIPLPFISYGGSFLITCLIGMGIVQSIWIHRREY